MHACDIAIDQVLTAQREVSQLGNVSGSKYLAEVLTSTALSRQLGFLFENGFDNVLGLEFHRPPRENWS